MAKNDKSELKIKAIENGTVIDHITANKSLHILKVLGLPDEETKNVTIAMNVSSAEFGKKDILKIENRELDYQELNQIALIAPKATINIIRNFEPVKKYKIVLPEKITSSITVEVFKRSGLKVNFLASLILIVFKALFLLKFQSLSALLFQ